MATHDTDEALASIHFTLNGEKVTVHASPSLRLSELLRRHLHCLDVKVGCNAGDCGACTVLLNGEAVCACITPVQQVAEHSVDTLSGLVEREPVTHKLVTSFLRHGAAQCGICTPGMLVAATPLLRKNPTPTEQQVQDALGGVLCRCTGYRKIIYAVMDSSTATSMDLSTLPGTETMIHSRFVSLKSVQSTHAITQIDGKPGDAIVRLDGLKKVTGEEVFGDDAAPADALEMLVVRSPFHHAAFTFGNLEQFVQAHPGVQGVLTAADIPGENLHGVIPAFVDQPVFAEQAARYKGEAVAAIVGTAEALSALDHSQAFPVEWHELPCALTTEQASAESAPQVHSHRANNIMCEGVVKRGDAETALSSAHTVVEGTFSTPFIEHAYIEPEAGYAQRIGDRVAVFGCTQAPYMNLESLARILGLPESQVRVVPTATGGGFGSKLDLSYQPLVALAAWVFNCAVRITFSRQESMQVTTKRHPSSMQVKLGADAQGRVCGMQFSGQFNTGAYASWGPTVSNRVPVHASGPYHIPHYQAQAVAVHTHCAPAGAFRGFGVPQAAIAQECLFDELANKLGIDRLAFRINNALDNNLPTVTGQVFEAGVGIKPCLESLQGYWDDALRRCDKWNAEAVSAAKEQRRGVAVTSGWYGCGNTSLPNPSCIKAGIRVNGEVCLHQGAVDIGQGSNTVIAQLFASALGLSVKHIQLISADTDITPDAGKTSASRQTFISGNAARLSGLALRAKLLELAQAEPDSVLSVDGAQVYFNANAAQQRSLDLSELPVDNDGYVLQVAESYDPPTQPLDSNGQGEPYALFGYAAHLVELEVDVALGTVKLLKFVAAHDVGKSINSNLVEGQIQGGIAQGVGLALMEEFIPGRTENLHDYLIPTIGDVPNIDSIIVEVADPHGPLGAKGLGEHVLIPTAPAILNAIRHACGVLVSDLPATPDKVYQALKHSAFYSSGVSS